MTPEQVRLVQESFEKVKPIAPTAAALFYGRLFEIAPSVRPMFGEDIDEQGRKLMRMLDIVVRHLTRLEQIEAAIRRLGEKHGSWGVQDAHYGTVAEALLWTLEQGLGADWDDELAEAWTAAYEVLAGAMITAAAQAPRSVA